MTSLIPIHDVLYIEESNSSVVKPDNLTIDLVGAKAFGLACLPADWTLPFFVISHSLLEKSKIDPPQIVINQWAKSIELSLKSIGISPKDSVHLRSSAINEQKTSSGKFITQTAICSNINKSLITYVETVLKDPEIRDEKISIIVQKSSICSEKGHLSNERRCSKEPRDWQGQIESTVTPENFKINLRPWREDINVHHAIKSPLKCHLKLNIQKSLKLAATWGKQQGVRVHFEWVWDGKQIFLVQLNRETSTGTFHPKVPPKKPEITNENFKLKIIERISREHAKKYSKIHNVYLYMDLKMPTTHLYILDNKKILTSLSKKRISKNLEHDLKLLTQSSLVIRMDIETSNQEEKQMLPRTHEVRSFEDAKKWLFQYSSEILTKHPTANIAFIFHNFIPSEASAFVFAAPKERKVQIESLWGIPEGLYYNPHDKFTVDTLHSQVEKAASLQHKFDVNKKTNYKSFCVAPTEDGTWKSQQISPPFDWHSSISKEEWVKRIAIESRKIAEREQKSISVMWFLGVPSWASSYPAIPWFHEEYSRDKVPRSKLRRSKTPFDKFFTIRNTEDINELAKEIDKESSLIRQILIQPQDEKLLRDKHTLKRIGEFAKEIDAVILLEGATLSHAFYQLIQTNATVHVENPFQKDDEIREFNKLVRDQIPNKIEGGGEFAYTQTLIGEDLTRALREKLVEESIEVLDATDHDSVLDEIADVLEVIDGLVKHLGADQKDIEQRKKKKREKAGGFEKGLILLETSNPSPIARNQDEPNLSLNLNEPEQPHHLRKLKPKNSSPFKKKTDRRVHQSAIETLLTLELPLLLEKWDVETPDVLSSSNKNEPIKATLKGNRDGAKSRIEISIYTGPRQFDLLQDHEE